MWHRYSGELKFAVLRAEKIRNSESLPCLSTRHLLLGLLRSGTIAELLPLEKETLEKAVAGEIETAPQEADLPVLTEEARAVLDAAYDEAVALRDETVGVEHLLFGLLRTPNTEAALILAGSGVAVASVGSQLVIRQKWRTILPEGVTAPPGVNLHWRRFLANVGNRLNFLRRIALALTQVANDPVIYSFLRTRERLEKPYLFFHRLRNRGFYQSRAAGGWVVSSYDAVQIALKEPLVSARRFDLAFMSDSEPLPALIDREFNKLCGGLTRQMLFLDAPEQTRLRSLVSRQFTPRVLSAIRDRIQETADTLLDRVEGKEQIDIIADFSFPLPATVIARLLGVDDSDLLQFKNWSDAFVKFISGATNLAEDRIAHRNLGALTAYFRERVAHFRTHPDATTLLSLLANASDEDGSRLTDDEVIMNAMLLLAAGHETTTHLIANGLWLLFQNPDALARLKADPERMPSAVEEMLRCEGPVQWTNRIARQDFAFMGEQIKRGEDVNIALAAANRDPARFADPDRFDIDRADNRHLAFGYGAHFCLGAALARMETEIALNTLLRRYPNVHPVNKKALWRHDFTFRAQKALPVFLR